MIVATSLPLSCRNFLQPLLHQLIRYVVVLDVAGSNPVGHPTVAHPSEMNRSEAPAGITAGTSAVPMSDFAPRWMPSR